MCGLCPPLLMRGVRPGYTAASTGKAHRAITQRSSSLRGSGRAQGKVCPQVAPIMYIIISTNGPPGIDGVCSAQEFDV